MKREELEELEHRSERYALKSFFTIVAFDKVQTYKAVREIYEDAAFAQNRIDKARYAKNAKQTACIAKVFRVLNDWRDYYTKQIAHGSQYVHDEYAIKLIVINEIKSSLLREFDLPEDFGNTNEE